MMNMALLELLAMVGTFGYGIHALKKDIQAEKTDFRLTPSVDDEINKKTIRTNFVDICKRSGITLNDNKPVYLEDLHLGMEYLQYRGFNPKSVEYFKKLYSKKFHQLANKQYNEILKKHEKILNSYSEGNIIATLRNDYYGDERPQIRMDKLYSYPLWNKLVDNYTYIRGQHGNAKYTEVWNLIINPDFLTLKEIKQIYEEVCWIKDTYTEINPEKTHSHTHSTTNKITNTEKFSLYPSSDNKYNNEMIEKYFIRICNECGINLKNNKPTTMNDCHLGVKYLQDRGFNHISIAYFTILFTDKLNGKTTKETNPSKQQLIEKHEKIIEKYHLENKGRVLFTHEYYGEGIFPRETKLRSYPAWNKIVYDFSSTCANADLHWTEKWVLKIKPEEYNEAEIRQMYYEICEILGIGL